MNRSMILRLTLLLFVSLPTSNITHGEARLLKGTFTGYSFTDRWGQGVFNDYFVEADVAKRLEGSWRPVKLTTNDIRPSFCSNRGTGIIHDIDEFNFLAQPPLRLSLAVDRSRIPFGDTTEVLMKVENTSDKEIVLSRGEIVLATTVTRQGELPYDEKPQAAMQGTEVFHTFRDRKTLTNGKPKYAVLRRITKQLRLHQNVGRIVLQPDGQLALAKSAKQHPQLQRNLRQKKQSSFDTRLVLVGLRTSTNFSWSTTLPRRDNGCFRHLPRSMSCCHR